MPKKKKGPDKATLHDQLSVDDPRSASAPDAAEEKGSEELSDDGSIKSLHSSSTSTSSGKNVKRLSDNIKRIDLRKDFGNVLRHVKYGNERDHDNSLSKEDKTWKTPTTTTFKDVKALTRLWFGKTATVCPHDLDQKIVGYCQLEFTKAQLNVSAENVLLGSMVDHLQAQGVLSQVPGMINMHSLDTESVNSVASIYKTLDDVKIESLDKHKYSRSLEFELNMSSTDYGTEATLFQEISDAFMTGSVQIPKRVLIAMYEYSEADSFMSQFITLLVRALGDPTLFTRTNSRCTELHRNHMVQVGSRFPVVCFKIYPTALSVFLHRQKQSDSASRARIDELKDAFPETQLQVYEIIEQMCAFDFLVGEGLKRS